MPLGDQLVGAHRQDRLDPEVDVAAAPRGPEQIAHDRIAPTPRDVGQQRLAVAVGEEARVQEVPIGRERVLHGAPHPHRGQRSAGAEGEILGHAFDEPEREGGGTRHRAVGVGAAAPRDVVLEGVHQLVAEHMVEVVKGAADRQDDPAAEGLGDAAGAFADAR